MASYVVWNKDQNLVNIATVNGVSTLGACTTRDYDIYVMPAIFNYGGWQACIVACGSASLQSCTFKLLCGIDGTNFMSFSSMTVSDTAFSGSLNMKIFSLPQPYKYMKLSLSTVSYGACVDSLASIKVLVFGKI